MGHEGETSPKDLRITKSTGGPGEACPQKKMPTATGRVLAQSENRASEEWALTWAQAAGPVHLDHFRCENSAGRAVDNTQILSAPQCRLFTSASNTCEQCNSGKGQSPQIIWLKKIFLQQWVT